MGMKIGFKLGCFLRPRWGGIGGGGDKKMPPSGGEPSRRRKLYLC